jgi:hypothetical protein
MLTEGIIRIGAEMAGMNASGKYVLVSNAVFILTEKAHSLPLDRSAAWCVLFHEVSYYRRPVQHLYCITLRPHPDYSFTCRLQKCFLRVLVVVDAIYSVGTLIKGFSAT